MAARPKRHGACAILQARGILCLVWFEDAIAPYGVPTVVFDVHVLVPDIDEAASVLTEKGWTDAGPLKSIYHFLTGPFRQRRLNPPTPMTTEEPETDQPNKDPPKPPTTVLLPAADCNVEVESLRPRSPDNLTLKTQDFAENLRLDHRQYHYDVLSKPGLGTIPFLREQRQIRDEIRDGKRQPQRNSWYLPPSRP
ncbi:hypothetical protein C8A03DRAFT_47643 [Achaetomium macrosporum]|uniref:Uncharacterized protein n=1 Tax=Achaetomium macrosporum TaxID=79813 RepID=A0AAN7H7A0_9PEZI|nr:hypothetical protein C8A03DRAFT_47643 [Achaetomium macrosporum]